MLNARLRQPVASRRPVMRRRRKTWCVDCAVPYGFVGTLETTPECVGRNGARYLLAEDVYVLAAAAGRAWHGRLSCASGRENRAGVSGSVWRVDRCASSDIGGRRLGAATVGELHHLSIGRRGCFTGA